MCSSDLHRLRHQTVIAPVGFAGRGPPVVKPLLNDSSAPFFPIFNRTQAILNLYLPGLTRISTSFLSTAYPTNYTEIHVSLTVFLPTILFSAVFVLGFFIRQWLTFPGSSRRCHNSLLPPISGNDISALLLKVSHSV